jgi:uncharacterized membrane protein YgcG
MKFFLAIWLFMALGSPIWARVNINEFDQQRPVDGIYDPGDWIYGPAKSNLTRELVSIKESSGIDVLVAVVESLGTNDPQELAEELANRWGYHGGRALILYVPENKTSPWIAVSGLIRSEMPAATLEAIINKAKQRARTDPSVHGAVSKAVDSLGEDLRFAAARAARGVSSAPQQMAAPTLKDFIFLFIGNFKKIIIVVGLAILICAFLIYWTIRTWKRVRISLTPKTFPEISWKPRFGAPYAGIVYTHSLKKKLHRSYE